MNMPFVSITGIDDIVLALHGIRLVREEDGFLVYEDSDGRVSIADPRGSLCMGR